jgi:hypothetical protein
VSNRKPIDRITQLIQSGLGHDLQKLTYYRQVMIDPRSAFFNGVYREYAAEILNNLLNITLNDVTTYNRVRQILLAQQHKMSHKAFENLKIKSDSSGVDMDLLFEVYASGVNNEGYKHLTSEERGFNAVNSFIANKRFQTIKKVLKEGN